MFGQDISLLVPIKQTAESRVRGLVLLNNEGLLCCTHWNNEGKTIEVAVLLIRWLIKRLNFS